MIPDAPDMIQGKSLPTVHRGELPQRVFTELTDAMATLRRAATQEDPQAVCAAFLSMREVAQNANISQGDVLALVDESLGETIMLRWRIASLNARCQAEPDKTSRPLYRGDRSGQTCSSAGGLLANAFSHCGCHMCEDGTNPCDDCRGTGRNPYRHAVCGACEGTGVLACSFCGGTRWVNEDIIPESFRAETFKRQRAKAMQDAEGLLRAFGQAMKEGSNGLSPRKRRELVCWATRVQARLDANLPCYSCPDAPPAILLASISEKVDRCWRQLVSRTAS